MSDWQDWIGRTETRHDRVDPDLIARWCATFDRAMPGDGTAPQGLHWCLAPPTAMTAALGDDGHPRRDLSSDSFLPPIALPRRMWAASVVRFVAPLPADAPIHRISRVAAITAKQGGSGPLVFVEIAHQTHHGDALLVEETQTIVYRDAPAPGSPPVPPQPGPDRFDPSGWTQVRSVTPGPPLLLRYSALTFNSHRIHYDAPYAMREEGYRGLVVHGPLTASLLIDLARQHLGENALRTFRFRGLSPAIADEPLHLCMRADGEAWAFGAFADDGRRVMDASGQV